MTERITVFEWKRADQIDIIFPHDGPVLTLTPRQARELHGALTDALAASEQSGAEAPDDPD